MWAIAEEGDPVALDQFVERYPDWKKELSRRIEMVRGLRGAKVASGSSRPAFQLRAEPTPWWRSPGSAVAATIAIAALGFASFSVAQWVFRDKTPRPPVLQTGVSREPFVVEPTPKTDIPPVRQDDPVATNEQPVQKVPAFLRPTNLRLRGAKLEAAIRAVGAAGELVVEIAPGLPDIDVVVDYRQQTPIAMLQEMGQTYAFTAFEQGDGKVLIVPAVDGSAPAPSKETPPEGRSQIPKKGSDKSDD
ncbi:MAG: hypothetical protein ACOYON_15775 [Fimbriimonas sp.]